MSIYGDGTPIKNGRTSSEISIYDYPEHLNPFYEDENHKRIRFWKIGKSKKHTNDPNRPTRRNSFSFGGLKDMWAFKSFRPKKSSTLGVNKTSESPPRLQTVDIRDTNYGTIDNRSRHSTGVYNGNGQQFQRNVPYRSSLQDMRYGTTTPVGYNRSSVGNNNNVGGGNGFGRNEMYRATIQVPSRMNRTNNAMMMRNSTNERYNQIQSSPKLQSSDRRYVYGGSVTPQPIRNNFYNDQNNDGPIKCEKKLGSSQLSVASSTNPFEDDYDDDKENHNSTWHGEFNNEQSDKVPTANSTNSLTRPYKKKRRAPPPPQPIPKVIEEENSPTHSIHEQAQNTNKQTSQEHTTTREEEEISNLTAEIESFVNQTVKEETCEKQDPPVPPERKYFREDPVIKIENNNSASLSSTPTIVITEEKQKIVTTTKKPSVTIISEPILIKRKEKFIIKDEIDRVVNEPQKVTVQTTIVQKNGGQAVTVTDTSNSNEKILNTDQKPIPSVRKTTEIHNEPVIAPENDTFITYNISSTTIPTSPKKEKPPLSPKPNLTEIQINRNTEQQHYMSDKKLYEVDKGFNKINSTYPHRQETTIDNNSSEIAICKYDHIPIESCELKIRESTEDISAEIANEIVTLPYVPLKSDSPIDNEFVSNKNSDIIKSSSQNDINEHLELREIKLENNLINNIKPRSHFTDEEPQHRRPVKYERKKSVREIIESINKNQSLLKINNTQPNRVNGTNQKDFEIKTNNLGELELKDLDESQRDFKRLLYEIENYECNNNRNQKDRIELNNNNNNNNNGEVEIIFNKIDQLNENGNCFKKCIATHHINGNNSVTTTTTTTTITTSSTSSRETSPTTSNLDWNPVPKPKRTKKT